MSHHIIDAKGKACPTPVLMARQAITAGNSPFSVLVDDLISVENLSRLGDSQGYAIQVNETPGGYQVDFLKTGTAAAPPQIAPSCSPAADWAIFVGRDIIGSGAQELGRSLMRMFFYTLSQSDAIPNTVLFMNDGVKLPTLDDQVVEHLQVLLQHGTEILVCGTCLNYYALEDKLQIGKVSNMYDILSRMQHASKVITL